MSERLKWLRHGSIALLLAGVVTWLYWPVREFDFINFDDPHYVSKNGWVRAGITPETIKWAFTQGHSSNWHPLTWISHMLDCQWFGLDAGKHHLTNLVLHALNSVLLYALLHCLTRTVWRSAVVAAWFALHPLHVESVAWVAERKDLLSGMFGFLTLLGYAAYARAKAENCRSRTWCYYSLALFCFALGLMSKPMLVTWPFVMLLLDVWPLGRTTWGNLPQWRRLIAEKIPFFALVVASCVITFIVQKQGGAVASLAHSPYEMRLQTALYAYAAYLWKMVWPTNLAVLYLPPEQWPTEILFLAALTLGAISVAVFKHAQARAYLGVGWCWYLGTLVPVIGLVQVGNQSMADRYTYLPLIGVFLMIVWGAGERLQKIKHGPALATALSLVTLLACGAVTRPQILRWRNSETLFTHTLRVTKDNYVIHNHLGSSYLLEGKLTEAEACYHESLRLKPGYSDALNNMGVLLTQQGKISEALLYLQEAVRISPKFADTYGKLAIALTASGKYEEAIAYYRKALALQPDLAEALNNLAWILATHPEAHIRNGTEAVALAETACAVSRDTETIYIGTLAAAYAEAGRFAEAVQTAERAQELARKRNEPALAARNAELQALYRAGKPYHEPPPQPRP